MSQETFQQALGKLVSDPAFRAEVQADPSALTSQFTLDENELQTLVSVGQACTGMVTAEDTYCCCCCCP